MDELPGEDSNL